MLAGKDINDLYEGEEPVVSCCTWVVSGITACWLVNDLYEGEEPVVSRPAYCNLVVSVGSVGYFTTCTKEKEPVVGCTCMLSSTYVFSSGLS